MTNKSPVSLFVSLLVFRSMDDYILAVGVGTAVSTPIKCQWLFSLLMGIFHSSDNFFS